MNSLHRQRNYWEPTFDPKSSPIKATFDWSTISKNNGPNECVCKEFDVRTIGAKKIAEKKFNYCDFNGNFKFDKTFTFKGCEFINCHFGWSNWENVKFQKCTFNSCAFSITKLNRCQFIECNFLKISVSSNETIFNKCLIDATKFIPNIITNLNHPDYLSERGVTIAYQKYRLSQTKAKVAKNVLLSLKEYGDENLFIDSVKIFSMQYNRSRIVESIYFIRSGNFRRQTHHIVSLVPRLLEYLIISTFGRLNRWGYSIGRIAVIGIITWLAFGSIYYFSTENIFNSLIKSFDILTLVGYSKYDLNSVPLIEKILNIVNLVAGISWFSLLFPTILARTSNRFE